MEWSTIGLPLVILGMLMNIYPIAVIMVSNDSVAMASTAAMFTIISSWVVIGGTALMVSPSNPFYRAWDMVMDATTLEYRDDVSTYKDECRKWINIISECADKQHVIMPDYTYLIYRYLLMNDIYTDTNRISDIQYEKLLPVLAELYPDTRWQ